jgi:2OG-Fe(II) oxygenase superfamily
MISYQFDPASLLDLGENSHRIYASNEPFPHIVFDDFIDPKILHTILAEVDGVDRSRRYAKFLDRQTDHNKFAFFPESVGPETSRLFYFLNSGPFLGFLEKLTAVPDLLADPSYFGGGLHWIENGGFLEVHADFNYLKKYNLERRLNLLLYLNERWQEEYHGQLELWDRKTMTCAKSIAPIFNRAVIFSTTRHSLHGHPMPLATPPGIARRSLALYYYTNTLQPASKGHSTLFYISRHNKVKLRVSRAMRGFFLDLVPPILRKGFRAAKRLAKGKKFTELWH